MSKQTAEQVLDSICNPNNKRFGLYNRENILKAMHQYASPGWIKASERISEVLNDNEGYWHSCSGCHETVDGQETGHYDYNESFKCYVGSGCRECGGLGVIWDDTDYSNYPAAAHSPAGEGPYFTMMNMIGFSEFTNGWGWYSRGDQCWWSSQKKDGKREERSTLEMLNEYIKSLKTLTP